jgi:hypothetical protein
VSNNIVIPALILLSGKSAEYSKILAAMKDPADVVTAAFNNMRNTLGQSLKMLEIRFQNILIVIGLHIIPVVTAFAKSFLGAADNLMAFVSSSHGLEIMKQFVLGLAVIIGSILIPVILHAVLAAAPFTLMMVAVGLAAWKLGQILDTHPAIMAKVQHALALIGDQLGRVFTWVGSVISAFGRFSSWVTSNQTAFTAFKAILVGIGAALMALAAQQIALFVGKLLWMIPFVWGAVPPFAALATEVILATWPFVAIALAVAAVVFGIMMLVSHGAQVKQFFGNIGSTIGTFFQNLPATVGKLAGRFVEFILDYWQRLPGRIAFLLGFVAGLFVRWILFMITQAPALLMRLVLTVGGWFAQLQQSAISHIVMLVGGVLGWFGRLKDGAIAKAQELWRGFLVWLVQLVRDGPKKAQDLVHAIMVEIGKLPDQAAHVIWQFEQGLVNGITSGAKWVLQAIENLGGQMIDGFKKALGISSPSTKMHQQGLFAAQGLANGLLAGARLVQAAWGHVMQPLTSTTSPGVGSPSLAGVGASIGTAATSGTGGRPLVATGGNHTTVHNWANAFPNIKSGDPEAIGKAVADALDQRERSNYRAGRANGGYGGLRAGLSPTDG